MFFEYFGNIALWLLDFAKRSTFVIVKSYTFNTNIIFSFKMFSKSSLDDRKIVALREHWANIPGIFRSSWVSSKVNIKWKKLKPFVTRRIWYFELGIFSFNSYVYHLTRSFIASTRAFSLLTRVFNLPARAVNLATRSFSLLTRGFELVTRGLELVTRGLELVIRRFELVTRISTLVTCNLWLVHFFSTH